MAGCIPHAVLSILTFHLRGPLGNHGYRLGKDFSQLRGHGKNTTKKRLFDFGVCLAWAAFVTLLSGYLSALKSREATVAITVGRREQ